MHDPRSPHLDVVYHILRYLKSTPRDFYFLIMVIWWWKSLLILTGLDLYMRSKKQTMMAISSIRSNVGPWHMDIVSCYDLKIWWRNWEFIISDNSISLFCDNKATINIAHNSVQHNRTKHIEIDMCFIKEKINDGIIYILFANSKNQSILVVGCFTQFPVRWTSKTFIHNSEGEYC
jgi:hypothetical protein